MGNDFNDHAMSPIDSVPKSQTILDADQDLNTQIIDLCKNLFEKWSALDVSRFSTEKVAGGITNLLLKVTVQEDNGSNDSVTVRLYGPNTDIIIDRKRELQAILALSAAGFGAKLLGIFGNGIVQSFINARTLEEVDLCDHKISAKIARQLNKFHQVEVPGSKEPQLWHEVFKFFREAKSLSFGDTEKQARYETISFTEIHDEIQELKSLTDLFNAPVVFAHNDLLSGNLMLNDEEDKLYIIDFEYGSYNFRGYDIANHFNEYAGYACNYSLYPEKNKQLHFFRNYLKPDNPLEVSEEDLENLYVETNTFSLASHLYWALWALIQARASQINFDYLGYFFLRYDEFKKQKEKCLSLARKFLSSSK